MRKTRACIYLVVFLFAFSANSSEPKSQKCSIDCLKERALRGDRQSARELSIIYGKINLGTAKYWHLIGAENGDPVAQYNYAIQLADEETEDSRNRAIFWLKKAAAAGDKDAEALLSKLQEHQKK